jgi:hypothetical protein
MSLKVKEEINNLHLIAYALMDHELGLDMELGSLL